MVRQSVAYRSCARLFRLLSPVCKARCGWIPFFFEFAAVLLLASMGSAHAAEFPLHFSGTLLHHNDVVTIPFLLDEEVDDVRFWTDSFQNGANFKPIITLWASDGSLIDWNDGDASIDPLTQTYGDAGLFFPTLWAGDYTLTLTLGDNYAVGDWLSDGFRHDGETPEALADWGISPLGNAWSVRIDPATPVPEPSSSLLFALGGCIVLAVYHWQRRSPLPSFIH